MSGYTLDLNVMRLKRAFTLVYVASDICGGIGFTEIYIIYTCLSSDYSLLSIFLSWD